MGEYLDSLESEVMGVNDEFMQVVFEGEKGLRIVRDCFANYLQEILTELPFQEVVLLEIALQEALNNALHAVPIQEVPDVPSYHRIKVTMYVKNGNEMIIQVKDLGRGFVSQDYVQQAEDIFHTGKISEEEIWAESGRGLLLMRAAADKIAYNRKGNMVTLQKRLRR